MAECNNWVRRNFDLGPPNTKKGNGRNDGVTMSRLKGSPPTHSHSISRRRELKLTAAFLTASPYFVVSNHPATQ